MITVNQPRENGRTTFCRQFTYNPKGEYNSRRDGAIVSGMPVAGILISELPDAEDGSEGTLLKFRENEQDVLFRLLKHKYEGAGSLIVRNDVVKRLSWNENNKNSYAGSTADVFLEGEYYNSLEPSVLENIVEVPIPYTVGGGNTTQSTLVRKIFLLSRAEVGFPPESSANTEGQALGYFISDARRIAYLDNAKIYWWTRSPRINSSSYVYHVSDAGKQNANYSTAIDGIRPALVLADSFVLNPIQNSDGSYSPAT